MALIALEESMQPPPDDAPEEDREAFDEMMDSMVADQFFGGDMTQVEDMFDSLPDLDPEECFGDMDHGNMGPDGMDHGNMGPNGMDHGNMGPDGMDHGNMGPDGMDHGNMGPDGMDHGNMGPDGMDHGNMGPDGMDHGNMGPDGMDHGNMGPNGMDHGNMGPNGMDHGNMGPDGMDHGNMGPNGMDHGNMGPNGMDHGNMGPDGMDHGNMGPDGMPMTMAVDPAACEAATTMIIDAGIDPRELAEMFMSAGPAGPESDPMPKLADTYFDGDIEAAIALMDGLSQTNTDPVMCGHIEPPM
jgi:hypothetical protein